MRDEVYDSDDGEMDVLDPETRELVDSEFFQIPDDFEEEEPDCEKGDEAFDASEDAAS
jgi:hypothetical protein